MGIATLGIAAHCKLLRTDMQRRKFIPDRKLFIARNFYLDDELIFHLSSRRNNSDTADSAIIN